MIVKPNINEDNTRKKKLFLKSTSNYFSNKIKESTNLISDDNYIRIINLIKKSLNTYSGLSQPQIESQLFDASSFFSAADTVIGSSNYSTTNRDFIIEVYSIWREAIETSEFKIENKINMLNALNNITLYLSFLGEEEQFEKDYLKYIEENDYDFS